MTVSWRAPYENQRIAEEARDMMRTWVHGTFADVVPALNCTEVRQLWRLARATGDADAVAAIEDAHAPDEHDDDCEAYR